MRTPSLRRTLILALSVGLVSSATTHASGRDGKSFDPGLAMTAPAAGAPAELAQLADLLGRWQVDVERGTGETAATVPCEAEITLFNRGHGYMERMACATWGETGSPLATISFLIFNPANKLWVRGEAHSLDESITMSQGWLKDGRLTLHDAGRPGGGMLLRHRRLEFTVGDEALNLTEAHSTNGGESWQTYERRSYKPVAKVPLLARDAGYGAPADGLPAAAGQFDFMIGEWTAQNDLTFANGQRAQWPAEATAVHALGGHGVLEFNWFDVDPQLPDAATTIIRLYNRAMRRWESLFVPNRGHSMLYFGGAWEGDRMVLHLFGADTGTPTISHFVFHSIEPDRYGWFAEGSTDRGATFTKGWVIDTVRKPAAAND